MKRLIFRRWTALLLVLMLFAVPAQADYWADGADVSIVCVNDTAGCQVLQMVMLGSFDFFDPDDRLTGRVLSAALDPLCAITDEDMAHFVASFGEDEAEVRRFYYIALGNCLWADIVCASEPISDARRVLQLFLNPSAEADGAAQLSVMRAQMSDALIALLAEAEGLPADFVYYLVYSENWRDIGFESK